MLLLRPGAVMPIYEYSCQQCGSLSTVFSRSIRHAVEPQCGACGNSDVRRIFSAFSHHRGTSAKLDMPGTGTIAPSLDYYKDPRNIGKNVEASFEKMGMELPRSVKESIQSGRDGIIPEDIQL